MMVELGRVRETLLVAELAGGCTEDLNRGTADGMRDGKGRLGGLKDSLIGLAGVAPGKGRGEGREENQAWHRAIREVVQAVHNDSSNRDSDGRNACLDAN